MNEVFIDSYVCCLLANYFNDNYLRQNFKDEVISMIAQRTEAVVNWTWEKFYT